MDSFESLSQEQQREILDRHKAALDGSLGRDAQLRSQKAEWLLGKVEEILSDSYDADYSEGSWVGGYCSDAISQIAEVLGHGRC